MLKVKRQKLTTHENLAAVWVGINFFFACLVQMESLSWMQWLRIVWDERWLWVFNGQVPHWPLCSVACKLQRKTVSIYDLLQVEMRGLTGVIKFDHQGFRSDFMLDIVELTREGLKKIGTWNASEGVNFTRTYGEAYTQIVEIIQNKTFVVTTILVSLNAPWISFFILEVRVAKANIHKTNVVLSRVLRTWWERRQAKSWRETRNLKDTLWILFTKYPALLDSTIQSNWLRMVVMGPSTGKRANGMGW